MGIARGQHDLEPITAKTCAEIACRTRKGTRTKVVERSAVRRDAVQARFRLGHAPTWDLVESF